MPPVVSQLHIERTGGLVKRTCQEGGVITVVESLTAFDAYCGFTYFLNFPFSSLLNHPHSV